MIKIVKVKSNFFCFAVRAYCHIENQNFTQKCLFFFFLEKSSLYHAITSYTSRTAALLISALILLAKSSNGESVQTLISPRKSMLIERSSIGNT